MHEITISNEWTHRIYVKHPEHTKNIFRAITGDGGFAMNLIHASMYNKEQATEAVTRLNEANPEFKFEARKI